MTPLAAKSLEIAETQMGIVEEKNNSGPHVEKYLASVGLGKGNPWCMAFVYWVVDEAAKKVLTNNRLMRTGHVLTQFKAAKAIGFVVNTPQPGDIFIQDHGSNKGHTGFVKTVNAANRTFTTTEGNSDAAGSRTGGSVCSNQRKFSSCIGYIRLP